jgi:mediator of RNA polymerase II transcription subunit 18, fungi type
MQIRWLLSHCSFKSESIEESYTYFRDNIEYSLVQYRPLPALPGADGQPLPLQSMPPWDEIDPVDPACKWILFVRSHVLEDNSPEKMQKAHEELMAIRDELLGVFEFKIFDRRAHDTRLTQQTNNMPAPLPQKVRA